MSNLQLSLLGMGVLLVLGIVIYNKLQERKFRKEVEQAFGTQQTDALLPDSVADDLDTPAWAREASRSEAPPTLAEERREPTERREPVLQAEVKETPPSAQTMSIPPSFVSQPATPPNPPPPVPAPAPAAPAPAAPPIVHAPSPESASAPMPPLDWCDSSIDAVVRLDFDDVIRKDELDRAVGTVQAQLRLPLRAYVQLLNGRWQNLDHVSGGEFHRLCLALQLVDRHGPVTKAELDSLQNSVTGLCNLRSAQALVPNLAEAANQARALDEFCAQLDLQLALNVLNASGSPFAGTKIRGLAEAAGMKLSEGGEFHAFDEDGNFLFAMANMGEGFTSDNLRTLQTHGLTFLLDVPHVGNGSAAFERMLATAKQCATALDGSLVNAQRAAVNDTMAAGIRKKIIEIHEQMKIAGIPAGGARALRLFS